MVATPAPIRRIWRIEPASVLPRCRPGDEVGHGDVEKARRREGKKVRKHPRRPFEREERRHRPQRARAGREHIEQQRLPARIAGMKQDGEIADFLRDLVCRDRDRHADAERHRCHDRGGNGGAIHEVVKRIADHHRKDAAVVYLAVVRMTVTPEHQLLEQEEQEDADEQRAEDSRGRQLSERRRQDGEHRDAEQRADRVAHEPRNQPGTGRIVDEENAGRDEQPAQAAHQAQPERDEERRHRRDHIKTRCTLCALGR